MNLKTAIFLFIGILFIGSPAALASTASTDKDGDKVVDYLDNCPDLANADQADKDHNGLGDVCDDSDQDGIKDNIDKCLNYYATDNKDSDNDGVGDACEDADNDGDFDLSDNCPVVGNAAQDDYDLDGIGDACDNCVYIKNADQKDESPKDGFGDVCTPPPISYSGSANIPQPLPPDNSPPSSPGNLQGGGGCSLNAATTSTKLQTIIFGLLLGSLAARRLLKKSR